MIGIIGAMDIEVRLLQQEMEDTKTTVIGMDSFTEGILYGHRAVISQCGPGKVNAAICTQNMITAFRPDAVLNVGVAGAGCPKVHVGDVVVALDTVQHDMDTSPIGDPVGYVSKIGLIRIPCDAQFSQELVNAVQTAGGRTVHTGTIATGDQFIHDEARRNRIHDLFGAMAVEMEGSAVAHVCYANHVPCGVLRTISDESNGEAGISYATFAQQAAEHGQKVVRKLMEGMDNE